MPLSASVDRHPAVHPGTPRESREPQPRILLVAASMRGMGGQAVMAQRLVEDLRGDGIPVDFLPVDPVPPPLLRWAEGVKYLRTLLRSVIYIGALLRHVPRCDLLHVFSASYSSFLVSPGPAILVARLFRKPVVLNYHSGEADDHLRQAGRITKWLLGLPHVIVVQSAYLVSVFRKFGLASISIPNHVDTAMFNYRERTSLQPRIVLARALERHYNIACALRAFRLVQDQYQGAEMVILGEGSEWERLHRLADDLQLSRVRFLGRVERAEIARHFDAADVFLNTSSVDNMPVSILEAFAAGLPVVSTNAGGIAHVITDRVNGHLVPPDDHVAVAQRLLELMEAPEEARRLSQAGRKEIRQYSWDAVAEQWKAVYGQLCPPCSEQPNEVPSCQTDD